MWTSVQGIQVLAGRGPIGLAAECLALVVVLEEDLIGKVGPDSETLVAGVNGMSSLNCCTLSSAFNPGDDVV